VGQRKVGQAHATQDFTGEPKIIPAPVNLDMWRGEISHLKNRPSTTKGKFSAQRSGSRWSIKDVRFPSLWRIFLSLFSNPPMATPGQTV